MSGALHRNTPAPTIPAWLSDAHSPWRAILESVHDFVLTVDRRARILFVNRVQPGLPADGLLGRSVLDFVPPDQLARAREALDRVFATGEPSPEIEAVAPGPRGGAAWYRAWIAPLHLEGRDGAAVIVVRDISRRRRAELALDVRVRQQEAVARLAEIAVAGGDFRDLLDGAARLVADTLEVPFSQVVELRPDGELVLRAGSGWPAGLLGTLVVPGGRASQAGFTLVAARPVVVENLAAEKRFHAPLHLLERGVVSGISVIIGAPERPYGVLAAHATEPRAFTADDVTFLQSVAGLVGAAIARRRAEDMRQHLLARAISAQEEERQRVARELHDETGQALSAILVGLRNLEDAATLDDARAAAHRLRKLAGDTVRDVGRLARGLRPSILDDLGLIPALRRYGEDLGAARHLAVHIADDGGDRFPTEVETTLYRIVQEALTNVARHARARTAAVIIERRGGGVRAIVQDDGIGFDVVAALDPGARQALGLMGMRERASLVGGTVVIESGPGAGTTVTATLPLP